MSKSAIYVLGSDGNITQMFVSESGFNVNEPTTDNPNEYTFSIQDSTVPIHVFNVSDQCTPDQTVLSECLNKTAIVDVTQSFSGNVLYLLIPEISLTKYSVATGTDITMTQEGQITVQVSTGSVPEITDLSSTQVEPETSTPSIVSGEHEIVRAFNLAKGIVDLVGQSNSSNSMAATASMTPSIVSSLNPWSKFG